MSGGYGDSVSGGRQLLAAIGVMAGIATIGVVWTSIQTVTARREVAQQAAQEECKGRSESDCQSLVANLRSAAASEESADFTGQQLWLNVFGLLGLGATIVYARGAWVEGRKGADAALQAFEAQIDASRPLMQLSLVTVRRLDFATVESDSTELDTSWALANHGATGCWTESVCIRYSGHAPPEHLDDITAERTIKMIAFVPPGKGVGQGHNFNRVSFSPEEFAVIRSSKRLCVYGRSTYRDAGGRRWTTGFAGWVDLDENLAGKGFAFYPSDTHWVDERIAPPQRRRIHRTTKAAEAAS